MNIISQFIEQKKLFPNLIESNNFKDAVDEVTYDQYESNNPLKINFYNYENIHNRMLKQTLKTTQNVGAEVVSAYTNPFYLTHKIINIPTNCQKVVDTYKKYST